MFRRAVWLAGAAILVLGAAVAVWHQARPTIPSAPPPIDDSGARPTPGLPWFDDVTAAAGINFRHVAGHTPLHAITETMGSGLAWIDYDNDGWLDLFCVQGGPARPAPGAPPPGPCRLFRNNGDGTFTDVTAAVGLTHTGCGMGVAVGDYDNDGHDDLVVTYDGGLVLYHNEPDGHGGRHFVDVTATAGLADPHWATSCAWGDVDGDGFLDLYVCNYVEVDRDHYPACTTPGGERYTCSPTAFAATTHRLFRNNGDGTFTDVSERSGIAGVPPGAGLGVTIVDLDADGRPDIYVANDMQPAYLFHNQGGGRFVDRGRLSGCAFDGQGGLVAGMGVAVGDFDGSGRPSLFVTNFQNKSNVLYRNQGGLLFQEWGRPAGLAAPSRDRLGFGTVAIDADLDGRLDLAVANGHVVRNAEELFRTPYAQEAQLFRGEAGGRFRDVSAQAGPYFRRRVVGRGLAWADYDNDGRPDLAVSHNDGQVVLLHNATATANGWLRLELVGDGKRSNRNAIGARVEVEAGGARQVRFVCGGDSYLSASDRRLLVGLGAAGRADRVTVVWPSGRHQEFRDLQGRCGWRLVEGQERAQRVR